MDHRRRLVAGGVPRRPADRGRARRRGPGPARSSCPTATTTAPGSTRRALETGRDHAGTPRTRPTAGSSATPTATPTGMLQEGAIEPGLSRYCPPSPRRTARRGLLAGPRRYCTPSASPAGRTPSSAPASAAGQLRRLPARRRVGTLTARVRGALWWERDRGAGADRAPSTSAGEAGRAAGDGRFDPGTVKIMQDGIIENRTAALTRRTSSPALRRPGRTAPTGNSGLSFVDPGKLGGVRDRTRRAAASRCTSTRSATGPCARRSTPSRRRAPPTAEPGNRHHLAHLQVVHPDDVAALRAPSAPPPTSSRCGPATSRRWTSWPSRSWARSARGWQYPFGSLLRAGAALAAGSDWPVSSPDPHPGHPRGGQPGRARRSTDEPLVPEERLALAPPSRPTPPARARVNHARPDRRASPTASSPTWWCSTATPSPGRRRRFTEARVAATFVDGHGVFRA